MSKSKIICKLFKLNNFDNLKDLKDLKDSFVDTVYAEPVNLTIADKKKGITLPYDEGHFFYTWKLFSDIGTLSKTSGSEDNAKELSVQYLRAEANIEYSKLTKRDSNKNYLPKKDRKNDISIIVYFLLINGNAYSIICSSNDTQINRVKTLIGNTNINGINNEFALPVNFFNWLFYKYEETDRYLSTNLSIKNIAGFIGNIADEHNIFSGISDQTSELIITKAFISNGETLKDITARLVDDDIDIVFGVSDTSNTVIYVNQSRKLRLLDTETLENFLIVYLYGFLIPNLLKIYLDASSNFLGTEKANFSKKIGLEVIKSIISNNEISENEISTVYQDIENNFLVSIEVE